MDRDPDGVHAITNITLNTPPPKERRTLLLLVVDQSGSMAPAWKQVQNALLYILQEGQSGIVTMAHCYYNDKIRLSLLK